MTSEFGFIGLGVMGKNLARNFGSKGFQLSLYNRHVTGKEERVAQNFIAMHDELKSCHGFDNLEDFVSSLETPRKILIMVNAGDAVDSVIEKLIRYVAKGDILIDGGNSYFKDSEKRYYNLKLKGIHFIGMGVSGGAKGALEGPSLMPGGSYAAFKNVSKYLTGIAALSREDTSCCDFIGTGGAGHFIKMVHNGIEYAEMQLIAEVYSILRTNNSLKPNTISQIFSDWNQGELKSYLLESTSKILTLKKNDDFIIDLILDKASHKGTGSLTSITAAELGRPYTMVSAALNARYISSQKEVRSNLSKLISSQPSKRETNLLILKDAYKLARLINHLQALELIKTASEDYNWNINVKNVLNIWTNGSIIASDLILELYKNYDRCKTLLDYISNNKITNARYINLKKCVIQSLENNHPIPCLSSALDYLNSMFKDKGSGNIIQAQRDFFGSHGFQRRDDKSNKVHHFNKEELGL